MTRALTTLIFIASTLAVLWGAYQNDPQSLMFFLSGLIGIVISITITAASP
jgi:hypothetical protein